MKTADRPDPSPDRRTVASGALSDPQPVGGPGSAGSGVAPQAHAWRAADAVRFLNRATLGVTSPTGYRYPSDTDAVVGALQTLADRLPQALTQVGAWLQAQHRRGRVGHDRRATHPRNDPTPADEAHAADVDPGDVDPGDVADRRGGAVLAESVRTVLADLDAATDAARDLARALGRARAVTSHLTGTDG